MNNAKINHKIFSLWNKYFKKDKRVYGPLFYDVFVNNALVFVGMNPSFSTSGYKHILRDTEFANISPKRFFLWKNLSKSYRNVAICIKTEKLSFRKYSYFKIMHRIANELSIPCEHIDLFLYKLTSQEKFKKLLLKGDKLNKFAIEQLAIFDAALNAAKPRVVVIANAYGSEIINKHFANRIRFDKKNGWHIFTLLNGKGVPLFFSSMVSGQRSLDVWSRNRLVWHIAKALKI